MTEYSNDPDQSTKPAHDPDDQNVGLARELFELILYNKKWWLVPVILALLVIAGLAVLGSSPLAPFIYTLF